MGSFPPYTLPFLRFAVFFGHKGHIGGGVKAVKTYTTYMRSMLDYSDQQLRRCCCCSWGRALKDAPVMHISSLAWLYIAVF